MTIETRLFINNECVPSSRGKTFSVVKPATDELITDQVHAATNEDVDRAVVAARKAFQEWRNVPSAERARTMNRFADIISQEEHAKAILVLKTTSMGVPVALGSRMVGILADGFRYYAGIIDKIPGEVYGKDGDGVFKMAAYEPIGVSAAISAWNGTPLSLSWKIAPAVAAGNTVIHKSSETDPLSTLYLGKLFKEAGFPPGVIKLLSGAGNTGAFLASHMDIDKIAFTGSASAGRKVQIAGAQSNLKQVTLELGVFLLNSGQTCSAASRVFVQESIAAPFIEGIKQSFLQLAHTMGDPSNEKTFLGPLVDQSQRARVVDFIEGAKAEGIEALAGGEKHTGNGQFVTTTVFLNPGDDRRIYREETFGPVLVMRTFKTEEDALALANDTTYGLSGMIFTKDISRAMRVVSKMEVGTLSINSAHFLSKETPWGGYKQSGYGREGGKDGFPEYLHKKTIHINLNL